MMMPEPFPTERGPGMGAAALSRSDLDRSDPVSARILDLFESLDDIRFCAEREAEFTADGVAE